MVVILIPAYKPDEGMLAVLSALTLLVLRVLADDHDAALALDDLALLADGLNRRSNFHVHFLRCCWGWFYALPRQVILPLVRS